MAKKAQRPGLARSMTTENNIGLGARDLRESQSDQSRLRKWREAPSAAVQVRVASVLERATSLISLP